MARTVHFHPRRPEAMANSTPLISMFNAAVASVSGKEAVIRALEDRGDLQPDLIVAVGKAASDMCLGAYSLFGEDIPAVVATRYEHSDPLLLKNPVVTTIESGHPVSDHKSLLAGKVMLHAVKALPADSELLLLVSGGASAIAEHLPEDMSLDELQRMNRRLLASGKSIEEINAQRKAVSLIKGGRLLENFRGSRVTVCAISDVQGDSIATIGSGIGDVNRCTCTQEVILVATNRDARDAAAARARELGYTVRHNSETLYEDVFTLAGKLGAQLREAQAGVYIWGGEPTVVLPEKPGSGGRNQSLALALAREISGKRNIHILAAGTDGSDGNSQAAGGWVDGSTFRFPAEAQTALDRANAGPYLSRVGQQFETGPTGTNVMDLVIALVE